MKVIFREMPGLRFPRCKNGPLRAFGKVRVITPVPGENSMKFGFLIAFAIFAVPVFTVRSAGPTHRSA